MKLSVMPGVHGQSRSDSSGSGGGTSPVSPRDDVFNVEQPPLDREEGKRFVADLIRQLAERMSRKNAPTGR